MWQRARVGLTWRLRQRAEVAVQSTNPEVTRGDGQMMTWQVRCRSEPISEWHVSLGQPGLTRNESIWKTKNKFKIVFNYGCTLRTILNLRTLYSKVYTLEYLFFESFELQTYTFYSRGGVFQNRFSGDSGKQIWRYYISPESARDEFSDYPVRFCTECCLFELQVNLSQIPFLQPNSGVKFLNGFLTSWWPEYG